MTSDLFPLALALALAPWQTAAEGQPRAAVEPEFSTPVSDTQDVVFLGETRPVLLRLHIRVDGKPYQAAWRDFIKEVFKYLDRNGDGILSKDEAERMLSPRTLLFSDFFNPQPLPNPQTLDPNKDGQVTLQELADYYTREGAAAFQAQQGGIPNPPARVLNESLFRLLDADKNGLLAKEELTRLRETFPRLDYDENEFLTAMELGPNPYQLAGLPVAAPVPVGGVPGPPSGQVLAVTPGPALTNLTRQLQARYGAANANTKDPKGGPSRTQLDPAFLHRVDANEDGQLSADELTNYVNGPPDLELNIWLGKVGFRIGQIANAGTPITLSGTKEQSGPLAPLVRNLHSGMLGLEVANAKLELARSDTRGGVARASAYRQFFMQQFKAADTDSNGYLETKETQNNQFFRNTFKLMDYNSDGKLYEKELMDYLTKLEQLQVKAGTSRTALTVTEGQGLFEVLDLNRDGRLSLREALDAPKVVAALDRDGDGQLAPGEILRCFQLTVGQGQGGGRVVVRVAGAPAPGTAASTGPLWFRKMDRNGDGDVSLREFLGTAEAFQRLDRDGDGLLSAEEAKQIEAVSSNQASDQQP